jgi:hypothetical protein
MITGVNEQICLYFMLRHDVQISYVVCPRNFKTLYKCIQVDQENSWRGVLCLSFSASPRNFSAYMEPEDYYCVHDGPYLEPDEISPHCHMSYFCKICSDLSSILFLDTEVVSLMFL